MATIQKRGSTYRIRVSCGYDNAGKQLIKSITWKPEPGMTKRQIEKELERQKVLFEERCRNGQVLDGSISFSDFVEMWLSDYAEKQLRAKTLARYRSMLPRIVMAIGHMKLEHIQPHHLVALYDNLSEEGIRKDTKYHSLVNFENILQEHELTKSGLAKRCNVSVAVINSILAGKNISKNSAEQIAKALYKKVDQLFFAVDHQKTLSSKTVLHHHRLISSILNIAVQWQIIFSNPCERVKPPKVEHKEAKFLDEIQTAKMLELLQQEDIQHRTMIQLLLYTGFRRGELCGLEWPDVDFDNRVITVRRSSLYLPGKGIFEDETKNRTSQRSIKVPYVVINLLREYRLWQNKQRLKLGDQWQRSNRLFTTWNGKPIHPDSVTSWFHDFIKRNDLPEVSIHSLRHTNATLQICGGVPLPTVASRLGHSSTTTTTKIYIHAIRSADEAAADTLENLLSPTKNRAKSG